MIRIGFTGTQKGMTILQSSAIIKLFTVLCDSQPGRMCAPDFVEAEFHMGDCIGADKRFWELCQALPPTKRLIGHIPDNNSKRAFCKYDEERKPKPYLERNHDIVDESDYLIATPGERTEQVRSGTWATVRYARKKKKKIILIYPDGVVELGQGNLFSIITP
jgi:hypothetical protein